MPTITEFEITQRKLQGQKLPAVMFNEEDVAYIYSLYWQLSPLDKHFQFGPLRIEPCMTNPRELKPVKAKVRGCFIGRDKGNDEIDPQYVSAKDWAKSCIENHEIFGVFVPAGDEPTEAELQAALKQLEAFYQARVAEADAFWMASGDPRRISKVARIAAEYFGLNKEWQYDQAQQTVCVGCKKSVPASTAKCLHCGTILDWARAYARGQVTRADAIDHGAILPPQASAQTTASEL